MLRCTVSSLHVFSRYRLIYRCLSGRNSNGLVAKERDEMCKTMNKDRKIGWKKKTVALVFGYVGTDYHGLQMIDPAVKTIEREVENALYSIGCILPTNRQQLDRIGWSRSSRTDKGSKYMIYYIPVNAITHLTRNRSTRCENSCICETPVEP